MDDRSLLGLPLPVALDRLSRASGISPDDVEVVFTKSPRSATAEGEARVVRVQNGALTAAYFPFAIDSEVDA